VQGSMLHKNKTGFQWLQQKFLKRLKTCWQMWKNVQINSLVSSCFREFSEKKTPKRMWLCTEFLRSGMLYRPGKSLKRCGKSSSLHSKKIFLLGGWRVFC